MSKEFTRNTNNWQRISYILAVMTFFCTSPLRAVQNFPPPEFETEYQMPAFELPESSFNLAAATDVFLLFAALAAGSWLAIKKRSRKGLFVLMLLCMGYFGFVRKGCVCPIGAIQNVSLSIFNQDYVLAWPVLAFFALPIIFSLFFGRVFCGSVCPLGAIQDLVVIKPVKVPGWLENILQVGAWLYLALAILLAATGTAFIICRFDPFISIYRFTASFDMMVLTVSFLVISMLIGRPYCRFVCPYGVILRQTSKLAKWKVSIVPEGQDCIQCKLCVDKCPFDAINPPYKAPVKVSYGSEIRKLVVYSSVTILLMALCGYCGYRLGDKLAKGHPAVIKAMVVQGEQVEGLSRSDKLAILSGVELSGEDKEVIAAQSELITGRYKAGSAIVLGLLAFIIGAKLIKTIIYRSQKDYEVDDGKCLYCGRCLGACPVPDEG